MEKLLEFTEVDGKLVNVNIGKVVIGGRVTSYTVRSNILNPERRYIAIQRLVKAVMQSAEWQSDQYRADTFGEYIARKTK